MQFTTGPFMAQRGLLAAEAPVSAVTPPGTYTTATLGSERDVGALFLAANPTITNQYQCNVRVDPAAPTQRQCISFKTGTTSLAVGFVWTTNGWTTSNAWYSGNITVGDPDSIWTNNGDLILGYLTTSTYGTRRVAGGGSVVSDQVSAAGRRVDYAHMWANRTTGRIYFSGRNRSSDGITVGWSDDNGATWSNYTRSYGTGLNRGFVSQGCVTQAGTVLIPAVTESTILSSNGNYAGSKQDLYAMRSTDSGASFTTALVANNDVLVGQGTKYLHAYNMWALGSKVYWLRAIMHSGVNSTTLRLLTSSDDGVTWQEGYDFPGVSGFDAGPAWIGAINGALVTLAYYNSGTNFQVWTSWSFDGGTTWSRSQVTTGTNVEFSANPRVPGDDQNWCDVSGNRATFVWVDNRPPGTSAGPYRPYIRDLTFS